MIASDSRQAVIAMSPPRRASVAGHVAIARIDHWFKNVFVLPGVVAALGIDLAADLGGVLWRTVVGLVAICLVASSNYNGRIQAVTYDILDRATNVVDAAVVLLDFCARLETAAGLFVVNRRLRNANESGGGIRRAEVELPTRSRLLRGCDG